MRTDLLVRADQLRSGRVPFVLATVVRAERPTSAKAGDRALVLADGTLEGFVGGTCAESTVRLQGLRLLGSGDSTLLRITPDAAQAPSTVEGLVTVGNPCLSGGTLEIFLEAMLPATLVYVFGETPVARALAAVGAAMGYEMRAALDPTAAIPADAAAAVVASHGRDEEPVLTAAVRAGVPYVALVASRKRGAAVIGGLDLTEEQRARIHSPAGLDIGARSPGEVAMSVLAELVSERPRVTGPRLPAEAVDQLATEAVDPVCGMTVAIAPTSPHVEHAGRTWYFCGSGCRHAFTAAPESFATP
jgi:xanthine dehydrogenase accessory factor